MMMQEKSFALALVTGASSGIGRALCHLLASKNIDLIITGRNLVELEKLAEELQHKVSVTTVVCDLSDRRKRFSLIEIIHQQHPDLIVNNAGFGLYGNVLNHATANQMEIVEVNANALLEITLEAAKSLVDARKKGTIINIASVAAFHVLPNSAVYAATKSFVVQLSRALDYELRDHEIRVLASCPGMVKTNFNERAGAINAQPYAMTAAYAAKQIWWQIQKGKVYHIFDWKYRFVTFLSKLFPAEWSAKVASARIKERLQ